MSEAKAPAPAAAAPSGGGGGIKALLPLILTVVLMPVLAYVMTAFVLVPKLQQATVQARAGGEHGEHGEGENADGEHGDEGAKEDAHGAKKEDAHGAKKEDAHGEKKEDAHGAKKDDGHGGKSGGSGKPSVQFGKVLVNVAGSLGARYLLTNFTLVGANAGVVGKVESNKDQLMDMTISTLRTKTIQDLEKPGAANLIRTELISVFNGVLGPGSIKEIYFTEFAIQ